jgi:hypothetical protein
MQTVLTVNTETASAHERSVELIISRAGSELASVMATMTAAMASAVSLQDRIEIVHSHSAEIESRQTHLEEVCCPNIDQVKPSNKTQGMARLTGVSEELASEYNRHTIFLHEAHNITNEILNLLENTANSATTIGKAFSRQSAATFWWPYIWCPAASLVMGSYGLPPSASRNIILIALGKFPIFNLT